LRSSNRISGIDIIGNIPWGTHFCQFYQTKEDLMDILVPFFKAGLENNEFCIWVISEPLDEEEIKEALKRAIPDFDTYLQRGQIEVIPYTQRYLIDGILVLEETLNVWIEKANQITDSSYDGLRLSGNSFWLETHFENFVYYEEKVDSVIGKYPIIPLCTYCLDKCNVTEIAEIVSNHQFALAKKNGRWEKIVNSGRIRAEESEIKLKETLDNLDNLVKERTEELEKSYKSLKESESFLAESQEIAHIGSWERNFATNKFSWSDEMYRIFGLKPKEFEVTYDLFLNYVHPDDRDHIGNAVKETLNGKPLEIDFRIYRINGEERIVHAKADVVFDEKNNPVRIRGITQDVTEHRKAEEEIKTLANAVESSNDAIMTGNLNGKVTSWNKGAEDIYGYSAEEILGKNASILEPNYLKGEVNQFNERIKRGEKVKNYETIRLRKDGTAINVSVTLSPILDNSGRMIAFSVIARDITERKKAEEALSRMEKIRIKEIHHRIKNNLQVISSLLDLQAEKFSNYEICHNPDVIDAFNESKNRVISIALIHEELYKGNDIDTLDFAAYLKKLAKDLLSSYDLGNNGNISLKLNLDQVYLNMDTAIPLGIIVNELVANSFKHAFPDTREGEILINIRKVDTSSAKNDISKSDDDCMEKHNFDYMLEVSDNGIGIPKDINIESLNSLGLQLVNILIEQIDGCLEIKSDKGTEFSIWFNNIEA
jgi:two-component system, sensor histidine kinase PdtaS